MFQSTGEAVVFLAGRRHLLLWSAVAQVHKTNDLHEIDLVGLLSDRVLQFRGSIWNCLAQESTKRWKTRTAYP